MDDKKIIETIKTYIRDKLKECKETKESLNDSYSDLSEFVKERAEAIEFVLTDLLEQIAWWEK